MHYVNCVYCEAYYSQDGNPFYVNDLGEHVCEHCIDGLIDVEKEIKTDTVSYTVHHDGLSELHDDFCYDVESALANNSVPYTQIQHDDTITEFVLSKEQVTILELSGISVDYIFFYG